MTSHPRQASPDQAKSDPAARSPPPPAPPQQIPPPQRGSSLRAPAASHTAPSLRHPQSVSSVQLSFRHCPHVRARLQPCRKDCKVVAALAAEATPLIASTRIKQKHVILRQPRIEQFVLAQRAFRVPHSVAGRRISAGSEALWVAPGRHNTKQISGALALKF